MDGNAGSAAVAPSLGHMASPASAAAPPWAGAPPLAGAPAWDRFAHWPRARARLGLLAVLLMLIAAAWVPIEAGKSTIRTATFVENVTGTKTDVPERPRDEDLALYD